MEIKATDIKRVPVTSKISSTLLWNPCDMDMIPH
jgi:hypothetical protein